MHPAGFLWSLTAVCVLLPYGVRLALMGGDIGRPHTSANSPNRLRALAEHLPKDSERAIGAALPPFQAEVLKLRGHCDNIVSMQNQPVPFPYYHTLTLQLSLNLLLMAYSMIEVCRTHRACRANLPSMGCSQR